MELLPKLFLRTRPIVFNPARTVFLSDLPVKWKRPERPKFFDQSKTGDQASYEQQDKNALCKKFEMSDELKTADEDVRKLFTLDFQGEHQAKIKFKAATEDLVRRHNLDVNSLETIIARLTGEIRYIQDLLPRLSRRIGSLNDYLHRLIGKRQKLVSRLRHRDYKRYEWLLEKLQLVYKPQAFEDVLVCRKEGLRKLTKEHCDNIKEDRLAEYRKQLESQQEAFLMKKLENLKFIRSEQTNLGVPVTVSQKDIDTVEQKYSELKKKREEEEKSSDKTRKWKMY